MSKDIYSQEFLHYFKFQNNKKKLEKYTLQTKSNNAHCGDEIDIKILIENGKIIDVGYEANGCAVSQGAMSIFAENIIGKEVSAIKKLNEDSFKKMLGIELTPSREKCALVGYVAIKNALKEYKNEKK